MTAENPGFAAPERGLFALRPDAAVCEEIGLRPIPFDEIGLYRDAYRRSLPTQTVADARAQE